MARLPAFSVKTNVVDSPHVVILGAGASKATCPNGDASGQVVPVMAELIDCLGIRGLLESAGIDNLTNFEVIYDDLASSGKNPLLLAEIERRVLEYFSNLNLPASPTIYDYLVLALRDKDFIATFNWDPFLIQAYRRNRDAGRLPRIAFLHGNVLAGACVKDRVKGIFGQLCERCREPLDRSRLLYPVRQKNYREDPYIANEWLELEEHLKVGYLLTIFGYAAPQTDVEAVDLMRRGWGENPTFELAQVTIVDIKPKDELERTWEPFFCRTHYGVHDDIFNTWLLRHPRRSCEALAMATLQNDPWPENHVLRTNSLEELHTWLRPLLEEEKKGHFTGKPCES